MTPYARVGCLPNFHRQPYGPGFGPSLGMPDFIKTRFSRWASATPCAMSSSWPTRSLMASAAEPSWLPRWPSMNGAQRGLSGRLRRQHRGRALHATAGAGPCDPSGRTTQTGGRDALVEGARTHDRPRSVFQLTEPGAIAGRPIDAGGL